MHRSISVAAAAAVTTLIAIGSAGAANAQSAMQAGAQVGTQAGSS